MLVDAYSEPKTAAEIFARRAELKRKFFPTRVKNVARECKREWTEQHDAHVKAYLSHEAERKFREVISKYRVVETSAGKISVEQIIREEAARAGITPGELKGRRRKKNIVEARQRAIARAYRERPDLSLPQLGRLFGGRDHSTILHAVKKLGVHTPCEIEYKR
ncbi:helix-turn-helix domain-containing protein [Oricola thermophila]|uniref:Chromosomal replication initiator DnaA C-terminal domain-containing protein n=1 Tax=Oricola thermophila TaxID=2742145 RepID=A0A6N1VA69_9HYPH|nr:helix-turn-helix domain-containing protein [Oricola thermophila]QKV17840.1 hypothetical protein HTY61_04890 [Oricola thermophila]